MAESFDPERFLNKFPDELLCTICLNVLKDPVVCGKNEHCFCRHCITRCLKRKEECPTCRQPLTINTLVKPSKLMMSLLARLEVRCPYYERGCQEPIQYEFLDNHIKVCDCVPVLCSNENCAEEVNKRDLEHHEQVMCQFRKTKCHDCSTIVVEIDRIEKVCISMGEEERRLKSELDLSFSQIQEQYSKIERRMTTEYNKISKNQRRITTTLDTISQNQRQMTTELDAISENQAKLSQTQNLFSQQQQQMNEQLQNILKMTENLCVRQERMEGAVAKFESEMKEQPSAFNNKEVKAIEEKNEGKQVQNIIITGIWGDQTVEMFIYADKKWTPLQSMKEKRGGATSFVHNEQLFVCGGYETTKKIETLRTSVVDIVNEKWDDSLIDLPTNLFRHCTEVYYDKVLLLGGIDDNDKVSNNIWEVQLQPPYKKHLLTQMSEPRFDHGTIIIDDEIIICGGCDASFNILETVVIYNIIKKKLYHLPSLPYPVSGMAVVKYKENMIIIGGWNKDERAMDKVLIYNTSSYQSNFLPSMMSKRCGCSAVVINNEIVVMGGLDDKGKSLDTVEVFNFDLFSWGELPAMNEARYYATAVAI